VRILQDLADGVRGPLDSILRLSIFHLIQSVR
jgi:hypothetical protein